MGRWNIKKNIWLNIYLPKAIFVEITNICNLNCTFCPNRLMTREKGFMDFGLFKKIVTDAKAYNIEEFNLWIMGEPFLHPHFFEFIRFAKDNKIRLSLITNGTLLAEKTDEFLSLGLSEDDCLVISCPVSVTDATQLRSMKTRDFKEYEKGIYDLVEKKLEKKAKVKIMFMYLLNVFSDIIKIPGLFIDVNGPLGLIKTWRNYSDRLQKKLNLNFNFSPPEKSIIKKLIKKKAFTFEFLPGVYFALKWLGTWGKVMLPEGFRVAPSYYGYCPGILKSLGIFWDGRVTFCCLDYDGELVIGNARDNSLSEIYNSREIQRIRSETRKGFLTKARCQICGGTVLNKNGKVLGKLYRRYFFPRLYEYLREHGVRDATRKLFVEMKGFYKNKKHYNCYSNGALHHKAN